ncbi:MAG: DNA-binding protein [Bacteroidales bacterium]|nr:DNA-binding protein [Bacteroidales bacterium]MBN2698300.1 DNA-binding protein [Bacteroidales bacterium]
MKRFRQFIFFKILIWLFLVTIFCSCHYQEPDNQAREHFMNPPESARPWVFWYWMHGAYSKDGITADLEAMKKAGIGGAFLVPIKGITDPPLYEPSINQLSPEWWDILKYTLDEARRCGIIITMHASDGFATAGGPWITPELSMQKVVWTEKRIKNGENFNGTVVQPEDYEGYYRDLAVYAFPTPGQGNIPEDFIPLVTTSDPGFDGRSLLDKGNRNRFRSREKSWIMFEYSEPVTCRSVTIFRDGTNFPSLRPMIEVSDDGVLFREILRLEPPRAGWLDWTEDVTCSVKPVSARYFRFIFDPEGVEPGAEDLDAAKWNHALSLRAINISGFPRLGHFEGKNGSSWRVAPRTDVSAIPDALCVKPEEIVNLTDRLMNNNRIDWNPPEGNWTIIRMGYTSTGQMNETGGAGKGLECDKFNPEAVKLQFKKWFDESVKVAGEELVPEVLKILHVDSWECGSQNWSPIFREEFINRRGYDPLDYLPVMAGIPMVSADVSERFLYDVRMTISELVMDVFYNTLNELAHSRNCLFSGECIAPVFVSDGMELFGRMDIPMGEFWLRSPSHDKLNDMLDAISGAHVYGKNIIQAEAFTEIRIDWDEHPGMIKSLGDRNLALGANRMVHHVFTHNPWLDRKPGMTLDRVGLYFQRDQTWWDQVNGWTGYLQRCQALLQMGAPVVDVAVFTGEEIPRRAITPERLVSSLPGIFGDDLIRSEQERLENRGSPMRELPRGVRTTDNMADPEEWIDPLRGYAYDSFNKDALLRLSKVDNGKITLPGGLAYSLLIIPGSRPLSPNAGIMSAEVAERILKLVKDGATVVFTEKPEHTPGLSYYAENEKRLGALTEELFGSEKHFIQTGGERVVEVRNIGKGRIIPGPYQASSFNPLGIERDLFVTDGTGILQGNVAWTHRIDGNTDIYFLSNQVNEERELTVSFRTSGRWPEIFDPVNGEIFKASAWRSSEGRTILPLKMPPDGSLFVIFSEETEETSINRGENHPVFEEVMEIEGRWEIVFDKEYGGPGQAFFMDSLTDWTEMESDSVRFYSGTAVYRKTFRVDTPVHDSSRYWIDLGEVSNIASLNLNGKDCGIAWTEPFRLEISDRIKPGENTLEIHVSNTWANRIIGDHLKPEAERLTWTTAPYRLRNQPLLKSGLAGPVILLKQL